MTKPVKSLAATVRRMNSTDVATALAILHESAEASAWPESSLLGFCARGEAWLAEVDSRIAGVVIGRLAADEFEILNLAVGRAFRRQGIATRLLRFAVRNAKTEGARRAYLEARASNEGGLAFYKRMGFQVCGRRKAYYRDPPEDAILLTLPQNGTF